MQSRSHCTVFKLVSCGHVKGPNVVATVRQFIRLCQPIEHTLLLYTCRWSGSVAQNSQVSDDAM